MTSGPFVPNVGPVPLATIVAGSPWQVTASAETDVTPNAMTHKKNAPRDAISALKSPSLFRSSCRRPQASTAADRRNRTSTLRVLKGVSTEALGVTGGTGENVKTDIPARLARLPWS